MSLFVSYNYVARERNKYINGSGWVLLNDLNHSMPEDAEDIEAIIIALEENCCQRNGYDAASCTPINFQELKGKDE